MQKTEKQRAAAAAAKSHTMTPSPDSKMSSSPSPATNNNNNANSTTSSSSPPPPPHFTPSKYQLHLLHLLSLDKHTIAQFQEMRQLLLRMIWDLDMVSSSLSSSSDAETKEETKHEFLEEQNSQQMEMEASSSSPSSDTNPQHQQHSPPSTTPSFHNQWHFLQHLTSLDPRVYNWIFSTHYLPLFLQIQYHIYRHKRILYEEIFWFLAKAPSTSVVRCCLRLLGGGAVGQMRRILQQQQQQGESSASLGQGIESSDSANSQQQQTQQLNHFRRYILNRCSRDLSTLILRREDGVFALLHVSLQEEVGPAGQEQQQRNKSSPNNKENQHEETTRKLDPEEESKRLDMITNRILDYKFLYHEEMAKWKHEQAKQKGGTNWEQSSSSSPQVASSKPTSHSIIQKHMQIISRQILYIYGNISPKKVRHVYVGLSQVIGKLMMRHQEIGKQVFFKPLLRPLYLYLYFETGQYLHKRTEEADVSGNFSSSTDSSSSPTPGDSTTTTTTTFDSLNLPHKSDWKHELLLTSEKQLTSTINTLYQIYFGTFLHENLISSIQDVVPALIHLFSFLRSSKLSLRGQVMEILSRFFRLSQQEAVDILNRFIVYRPNRGLRSWHAHFEYAENGGVCIRLHRGDSFTQQQVAEAVVFFLEQLVHKGGGDELLGDFLVHLMSHFTSLKKDTLAANSKESTQQSAEEDHGAHSHSNEPAERQSLVVLQTLVLLIDKLGDKIMNNMTHTLRVVKFLLLAHQSDEESPLESDYVQSGVSLLVALLTEMTIPFNAVEKSLVSDIDSILERHMQDALQKEHSNQIRTYAQCRSLLSERLRGAFQQQQQQDDKHNRKEASQEEIKMEINNALKELKDPLEAVQAHGLAKLRQLVLNRHPLVQQNVRKMLNIFKKRLSEEDEFVYNSAIRGLSAMGDVFPDEIIPLLTEEYRNKKREVTFRAKVGEALLLIMRRCGELLPKYASQFVNTFLVCCREQSSTDAEAAAMIRSSSLSNIATAGEILRFGVYPFIADIVDCLEFIIQRDPDGEVRKAAVLVIHRMLAGFQSQIFSGATTKNQLVDTNRLKKILRLAQNDGNPGVRYNAESTENFMDDLLFEHLRPKGDGNVSTGRKFAGITEL